jgi:hypothetical protein
MDVKLQRKICADLTRRFGDSTACLEFLLSMGDTVRRLDKKSSLSSADAAHLRRLVVQQCRSVIKAIARPGSAGR